MRRPFWYNSFSLSSALNTDENPKVRVWHSIPFSREGFCDDGSFSVATCLMMLLIAAMLELVTHVGVGLAYTKMVIAYQDDTVVACSVHHRCVAEHKLPRIFADLQLAKSAGSPAVLGKPCVLSTQLVQDTAIR